MRIRLISFEVLGTVVAIAAAGVLLARPVAADARPAYRHVGTFSVPANLPAGEPITTITSAEIVDFSSDGMTLVYTDSPSKRVGFIDVADPAHPAPGGVLDTPGEPTSIATVGEWALVAVSTRADPDGDGPLNELDAPSGVLLVVELRGKSVVQSLPLSGQPDSIAISPDQRYAAIVIENERDEDENEGLIPQAPAGALQVIELTGKPADWKVDTVELTGLAEIAPDDPEPEFVDINANNRAVVSLQENNHLVIVDLPTRSVVQHFSAGEVTLDHVDATQDELGPDKAGIIQLSESITRRREPDAVAWIDDDTFATANEGDYKDADGVEGGSRGFTLFNVSGEVEFESGNAFEHELVRVGHYPEGRSGKKGGEPEGLELVKIGERSYLMVGAERANAVAVYDVTDGAPELVQILPTGIGPEGIRAISSRGLLAVSAETDGLDDDFEIRPIVTLFEWSDAGSAYPMLVSDDDGPAPIPWAGISGLSGDAWDPNTVWAVSDAVFAQAFIYRIDVSSAPARITRRIAVGAADGLLDLEGIAARRSGGFWLASEGSEARPNALLRVDSRGKIRQRVELPAELLAHATTSGFEGVAVSGSAWSGDEVVWVAFQREWLDDPAGFTKIGRYDVAAGEWTFARYPLDAVASENGGWVGLSELTLLGDGTFAVVERDNQEGLNARIKRLYRIDPRASAFVPYGQELPVLDKTLREDVLGPLDAHSISIPDKLEGVGLTRDGRIFLATDNDGTDQNYGETLFFPLAAAP